MLSKALTRQLRNLPQSYWVFLDIREYLNTQTARSGVEATFSVTLPVEPTAVSGTIQACAVMTTLIGASGLGHADCRTRAFGIATFDQLSSVLLVLLVVFDAYP